MLSFISGRAEEPTAEARKNALCSIREGMSEEQVKAVVGPPDEVRTKGGTGMVDENYRWVYGVAKKGEFPRIGSVIFGTNHTVFMTYCPTRSVAGAPSVRFSEFAQGNSSGLRCGIEKVFSNPEFYNAPYIRVSLNNAGRSDFLYANDDTGIRFNLILEVYDEKKILLLREYLARYHSPVYSDKAKWPVLRVPAGGQASEDVPVWWRDENDGILPPGTYYVRVAFPFEAGIYYGSELIKWDLPRGLEGIH